MSNSEQMNSNRDLTERQKEILKFIFNYLRANGYPPTLREICSKFNIASTYGVKRHLEALSKKGYIKVEVNSSRAIKILEKTFNEFETTTGYLTPTVGTALKVPIIGKIAAGSPIYAEENIEEYLEIAKKGDRISKDCFALRVKGDSMINAGIFQNDIVVINPTLIPTHGDIVAAAIEDTVTLKRILIENDRIILKSENENYKPIILNKNQSFSIIGKMVLLVRTY